jgi:hypothetical protein
MSPFELQRYLAVAPSSVPLRGVGALADKLRDPAIVKRSATSASDDRSSQKMWADRAGEEHTAGPQTIVCAESRPSSNLVMQPTSSIPDELLAASAAVVVAPFRDASSWRASPAPWFCPDALSLDPDVVAPPAGRTRQQLVVLIPARHHRQA